MRPLEFWNDYAGPGWAAHAEALERISGPLGAPALTAADVRPGMRVLDIGCGPGGTTLALAERTGPAGRVVGVDLSAPMLAAAAARAAHLDWVSFREADLHSFTGSGPFDVAYSRMCLMLLDDPVLACRNVLGALRPGGRLCATVFRGLPDNAWLPAVVLGTAPHVGPMPPLPLPGEPGPFAWADADIAAKVLDAAGFATVRVEACDPVVRPTGPADEVAELLIELGPAGGAYRAASADAQAAARAGVLALLQRFRDDAGDLALPCGVWLITASRPALS